jgi:hypothetical protein
MILLISASEVPRIIGVSHWHPAWIVPCMDFNRPQSEMDKTNCFPYSPDYDPHKYDTVLIRASEREQLNEAILIPILSVPWYFLFFPILSLSCFVFSLLLLFFLFHHHLLLQLEPVKFISQPTTGLWL